MYLFLYDEKHEQILAQMFINDALKEELEKIIKFADENKLTNRYKRLIIAKDYNVKLLDEGFHEIEFIY
jgi:hypothetical protein